MRTLLRESGPDAKPGTWRPAVSKGEILPIVVCPKCSTKIMMSRHGDLDGENYRDYAIGCGCPKCGWSEGVILDGWPVSKTDPARRSNSNPSNG